MASARFAGQAGTAPDRTRSPNQSQGARAGGLSTSSLPTMRFVEVISAGVASQHGSPAYDPAAADSVEGLATLTQAPATLPAWLVAWPVGSRNADRGPWQAAEAAISGD
jgi:hypothetical protein